MIPYPLLCEAAKVDTESKICPGMAKTEQGETYVFDGRTPGPRGVCCQAFGALTAFRAAMMVTDKLASETQGHLDILCPHGVVTFRLSRRT